MGGITANVGLGRLAAPREARPGAFRRSMPRNLQQLRSALPPISFGQLGLGGGIDALEAIACPPMISVGPSSDAESPLVTPALPRRLVDGNRFLMPSIPLGLTAAMLPASRVLPQGFC